MLSSKLKLILRRTAVLLTVLYLGFHSLHGERGLYAWFAQSQQSDRLQQEIDKLKKEQASLKRRINGLQAASLDTDLLDERLRYMGSMAEEEEQIILYDEPLW